MATLRLKEALKEKQVSHTKFALMLGWSRGTLARYLRAGANPTLSTLTVFAKTLRVRVKDLIKD